MTDKDSTSTPLIIASPNVATDSNDRALIRKRGNIKTRVTMFNRYLITYPDKPSPKQINELKLRKATFTELYHDFNNIQSMIEESALLEVDMVRQAIERETFENDYYNALSEADTLIDLFVASITSNQASNHVKSEFQFSAKLPTISLPTFEGRFENWMEFRDTYVSMIHNSDKLEDIQKFHYLRSALKGEALQIIKSINFSSDNYKIAWSLLENRFNKNKLLTHSYVKALFSLNFIQKESSSDIRKLIDTVLQNLRSLESLGEPTKFWDTLIIYLIVSKLDPITAKEWEQFKMHPNSKEDSIKLDNLIDFLNDKSDMLDMIKAKQPSSFIPRNLSQNSSINNRYSNPNQQRVQSFVSTQSQKQSSKPFNRLRSCVMCNDNHSLYSCSKFLALSHNDKLKFVINKNLCQNCLRVGHTVDTCYFGPCRQCNKKHNSLLHGECNKDSASLSILTQSSSEEFAEIPNESTALQLQVNSLNHPYQLNSLYSNDISINHTSLKPIHALESVLLSTAIVDILGSDDRYYKARALLDSGSQHCLITKSFSDKLKIKTMQSTYRITGVGNLVTQASQCCVLTIRSLYTDYNTRINCIILPYITTTYPSLNAEKIINLPESIQLADPQFSKSSQIDILIGANLFWDLITEGKIRLTSGPHLQETKLGWIISGPVYSTNLKSLKNIQCNFNQSVALDEQLRKFWEIEEIPNKKKYVSPDDLSCENLFLKSTKRLSNGRFVVQIPLKESPLALGDSYVTARNRFLALERRLDRTVSHKQMYSDFINEYIKLGHMSRISHHVPTQPCYYLAHHGVFRQDSLTTKLRVVFNASQKTSSGKSLNDIQWAGPALQNDLIAILLRFRQYKYVACADIEKFFRQILIQDEHKYLQLILWREKSTDPIDTYRLETVTYGFASSPYLSIRCLQQLALDCNDKEIARTILEDMYVDDLITGNDCKSTLTRICLETTKVCMSGCFPLRKWIFNSPDIASDILQNNSNNNYLSLGDNCLSKTLGLGWCNSSDAFQFTTHINIDNFKNNFTKREILSVISQIYDPLGFISPVIITAKILLQKLWLCKIDWDDELPNNIIISWQTFLHSLKNLHSIRVPRHVIISEPISIELHIFTDASEVAYGACAYIRSIDAHGKVDARLLCSKSRVASIKPLSTPRLELCGAVVGARLLDKIKNSLRVNFNNIVFWLDSTIVLGWIRTSPQLLKTFVQSRVVDILELTGNAIFLHVKSKDNPADILSRGLPLDELTLSDLWWHGPSFLKNNNLSYSNNFDSDQIDLPELKSKSNLILTNVSSTNVPLDYIIDITRFSSFNKLKRCFSYVLRFINNLRCKNKQDRLIDSLTVNELNHSFMCLIRIVQNQSFPNEYNILLNNLGNKKLGNLSNLNLFLDDKKIIRVGGRIGNAIDFSYDKKFPILLSSKHYFTVLLFRHEHKSLLHGGPQLLLSHIRDCWWPIGGRNLAKLTVRKCVICCRLKANTIQPIMANLPKERLQPGFPFLVCGVDYAGPFQFLNKKGRGSRLEKCYICLFVCFTTKAIHLELVTGLSSEDYIMALKRFISRRGKPQQIFSDNGRNFVGAAKEFSNFINNDLTTTSINNFAADNHIDFKFIPPYTPHFGGLWEAGVKSCKHHLIRVIGNANLTYVEFNTVLVQIEAVLNSRPLHPLSADPNDLSPLTPGHFLVGRPLTAPFDVSVCSAEGNNNNINSHTRFKRIEIMRQHFWKRWMTEYITELQKRTKWKTSTDSLQPNSLVIIKEDNLPPLKWRMGRILAVHPGKDGVSRVASIKTAQGTIQRAYTRICPLPDVLSPCDSKDLPSPQDHHTPSS